MTLDKAQELLAYLLEDRQWHRHLRIQHANYKLQASTEPEDRAFWELVLKANTGEENGVKAV